MSRKQRALILAGGGYVASSWEIGVITGMADEGLDLRDANLFVGTSAGARVAIDLTSGRSLKEIYKQRIAPGGPSLERSSQVDWARIRAGVDGARQSGGSPTEILQRYGQLALEVGAGIASDRREAVASQLSSQVWPEQRMLIPVVNAETGQRCTFDRECGIDLVDAVIATTSSFGSPPVFFKDHHYIDGGYYSSDNADLAIGYERVLILALRSPPQAMRVVPVEAGVEALRAAGAQVDVIHPDEETMAALAPTGGQMNPASGKPGAIAGRLQGQRCANEHLRSFWRSVH